MESFAIPVFIIAAMILFFVLSGIKAWRYFRMPAHGRLEIYPVPKEGGGRAEYGGSYMEEVEWWRKERKITHVGELVDMLKEMLLIKKLFENQRSLWWASYAFHLGIYVMLAWTFLLVISVFWSPTPYILFLTALGAVGFGLAGLGCLLLILRRIFDASLRKYTNPLEFFNIIFVFVVLLTGAVSWLFFASPFDTAKAVLGFDFVGVGVMVIVHLLLLGLMLIYIPVSKMGHYVGKFFSFHKVLWDNDPNFKGSKINEHLKRDASVPPTTKWDAPHINPPAVEPAATATAAVVAAAAVPAATAVVATTAAPTTPTAPATPEEK